MQDFLTGNTAVITAIVTGVGGIFVGILTALVAPSVKYWLDKRFHKYTDEYEQRKRWREPIRRSQGQLVQAAENLDDRIGSLYRHISIERKTWLKVRGNYADPGNYYFRTMVYKFLAFYAVIRQFEEKNLFVDSQIAEEPDLDFLKYIRALQWVVSGTDLFKGFNYDPNKLPLDHIYSDKLREMADSCLKEGKFLTPTEFQSMLKIDQSSDRKLDQVLKFFDGLEPEDRRYRWDRIVALHLILKGFLDRFGYDYQKLTDQALAKVATEITHPKIFYNLIDKFAEFGLDKTSEVNHITRMIRQELTRTPQ